MDHDRTTSTPGRDSGKLTTRGAQTRARLVEAAKELFQDRGYLGTSVADVAKGAGVANGTFYIYFSSKDAVFEAVVELFVGEFESIASAEPSVGTSPAARIARSNRGYLNAYAKTARMMAILEQASTLSPHLSQIRRDSHRYLVDRTRRAIAHWQMDGLVARDIDAHYAAVLLGGMVSRFAYSWIVLGESVDSEIAIDQLNHMYCNALGLQHELPSREI
jgi:AcrR family transcriptional regulator